MTQENRTLKESFLLDPVEHVTRGSSDELLVARKRGQKGKQGQTAAEPWNFTRADYARRKGKLKFSQSSRWVPNRLKENLLNTIHFVMSPERKPPVTEGVNLRDFYHGHLLAPHGESVKPAGAGSYDESTPPGVFRKAYGVAARKTLSNPRAAVLYHTMEDMPRGEGVPPGDARFNYLTLLADNKPRPRQAPNINVARSWIGSKGPYDQSFTMYFLIDQSATIHVVAGPRSELEKLIGPSLEPRRTPAEELDDLFGRS